VPVEFRPQPGPQTEFLSSSADIAIYGGAAGGGKTFALLMEPLRHVKNPRFGAVLFRRTTTQVRNEGGPWDESMAMYPNLGGTPKEMNLEWRFPSGAAVTMAHLEHDKSVLNWQGGQITLEMFDELTHFSEKQFFYMLSRNRSTCGVRPYVRASTNPDADSWVAKFIEWWIDQETGYAIPERAGVLRYFVRIGDNIVWGDTPEELEMYTMPGPEGATVPIPPKSVTFIPSKLSDNKILMEADPGYMANLMALPLVERERLLGGNWKIRPSAGLYFKREWVTVVDIPPACTQIARGWDLAATPLTANKNPDGTASVKIGTTGGDKPKFVVFDATLNHLSPSGVEALVKKIAEKDEEQHQHVVIDVAKDPGQAGKSQMENYAAMLNDYEFRSSPETGDKITRFSPFSAQAEAGNVVIVRGPWNELFFQYLENFPEMSKDDIVDATSRAFAAVKKAGSKARMFLRKVG
jgi:predicted phage terminase large subunit-like protein